jgi:hypothetical protein
VQNDIADYGRVVGHVVVMAEQLHAPLTEGKNRHPAIIVQ